MDPLTIALLGATGLSSLLGGQNTSTTSTQLSPELQALVQQILDKAVTAFNQPYTTYPGERVAGPTQSRDTINSLVSSLTGQIGQATQKYSPTIDNIIGRSPVRVQIPTMVSGGPSALLSGGGFGNAFATNPGSGGQGGGGGSAANPWASITRNSGTDALKALLGGNLPSSLNDRALSAGLRNMRDGESLGDELGRFDFALPEQPWRSGTYGPARTRAIGDISFDPLRLAEQAQSNIDYVNNLQGFGLPAPDLADTGNIPLQLLNGQRTYG